MKVDWDPIYASRGLFSGYGSRGACASLKCAAIKRIVQQIRPRSILDVGCGDLHIVKQVQLEGAEYLGLDLSSVAIEALKSQSDSLPILHQDFLEFDSTRQFELALCLDVLIHAEDLAEYRRITERLKRVATKGLLVSGYDDETTAMRGSRTIGFHESLRQTFADYPVEVLGQYRDTTLMYVDLEKKRDRKHRIWTYWENPKHGSRPPYLDLCEETWHRHCGDDFQIIRVTPETVDQYAPDIIPEWHRIPCLAHKADYLRAVLVHRHGGIWLDSDIIVLKNLREMLDQLQASGSDFIGCGRPGKRPSNGVFGGTPGSKLLQRYIEAMNEFIQARNGDLNFKWTEIGYNLLWPLTRTYDYFQYEFRVCIPVHPSRYRTFFESVRIEELDAADCDIRPDTLTVYLYNAMFPAAFKSVSTNNLVRSPMVIGQMFRRALGIAPWRDVITEAELREELGRLAHRNDIPRLLRRVGLNHRVGEVGVRTGANLQVIVRGADPDEFVGVDAWADDAVSSRNDSGLPQSRLDDLERQVRQTFQRYGERGRIIRQYSVDAAAQFPDNHFDYVYLDADHSYEAVQADLEAWYPKVRPGGLLAGHDYVERQTSRVRYGVVTAVNEFASRHQVPLATTSEHFASWMILKPRNPVSPRFCYWSIGVGNDAYHAFLRSLIGSARQHGVTEDFHVWTDAGVHIDDCEIHEFDRSRQNAPRYMFKAQVLKAMQEFPYDYYVFLDADNYFVRKPAPATVSTMLRLANPLHLSQESKINADEFSPEQLTTIKWWGVTLQQYIDAFHAKGLAGKRFYLNNAGFFVVKGSELQRVYDAVWEGFRYLRDELGYVSITEESAFAYAMAKLTNPEGHRMILPHVSDIWCTDRGNFHGRLPDGQAFDFWTNWDGCRFQVNPAIVHAMKSKPELLTSGGGVAKTG